MGGLVQTAYYNYLNEVTTEMTLNEFKKLLINDDEFNKEWSNGCTKELTYSERCELAKDNLKIKESKKQKYGKVYITIQLNELGIPKRVLKS